ncbi:MAG: aminotransferase class V-fold PLP-dependent enzyme [Bacteroidia bacterium]|nr:aminotransferase class V-fold PLP-dependent enzyme [Bacteroidia bacterium]
MIRKTFIAQSGGLLLSTLPLTTKPFHFLNNSANFENLKNQNSDSYRDEKYWNTVREMFNYSKDFINLENGYFSPAPISTENFYISKAKYINAKSSWFMRREQQTEMENTRKTLALFLNLIPDELAITRNTTESLNTIISGYPWKKGDEVIVGNQDYGSMIAAFEQQVKRSGIILKTAQIPMHPANDDEIVNSYISLITPKTRIIHLTHLINLSGQILPAKKIIDAAHNRGIEVILDAAHSVAHINFNLGDLEADYIGASLHKWLCCPLGVGFLAIKKKHIAKIYPLMGDNDFSIDDIRKFEHTGTKPMQTIIAINEAIKFHNAIGSELKEKRLSYLKNYWVQKIKNYPYISINTPVTDENRSCAIANFSVSNYTPQQVTEKLLSEHKIFTVAIEHPFINGVRVTPHLYNSTKELDKFVDAISMLK